MKSLSSLTDFYYKVLYTPLKKLEKDRKQLRHRIFIVAILFTTFTLFLYSFVHSASNGHTDFMMFFAFGYFVIGSIIYKMLIKDYTKEFKEKIIAPLITEIDSNLSYSQTQHVRESKF